MIQKVMQRLPEAGITRTDLYLSGLHGGASCSIKEKVFSILPMDKTYGDVLYSMDLAVGLPPPWQGERTRAGLLPLP